jgi:poly(beta-D-mannuronate) lyase
VDGACDPRDNKPLKSGHNKNTFPMDNTFEGCEWYNLSTTGEPLRIGDSRHSHLTYNTTISDCIFRDLRADKEAISIKSCGNTIVNCQQNNSVSSFVIRSGHTNTIEDCTFTGSQGGIRVYGKDNHILGNTFQGNTSNEMPPLLLVNGNVPDEPNEGAPGHAPKHDVYTQVRNCEISGNTFVNCVKCVVWGRDREPWMPEGVTFEDNKVIAEKVQSVAIEFLNAEPFLHGKKELNNTFADNTVVGNASIDRRIAQGFEKEIIATQ